ncbi:hypothetical protein BSKO_01956 [Bryopsis sp. KO-2023]|nr:hypothetical protein BSKO_01956 [Bryopsis sp. KO-2023]
MHSDASLFVQSTLRAETCEKPSSDWMESLDQFGFERRGLGFRRRSVSVSSSRRRSASVCTPTISVRDGCQSAADRACVMDVTVHEARAREGTANLQTDLPHESNRNLLRENFSNNQALADELSRCAGYAKRLLAGATSAAISKTTVAPFERIRMDILLRNSTLGPRGTALGVWKREGVKGFWKGNLLNIMRNAPFKAVNFFAYDMFSKAFARFQGGEETQVERFAAGALAGITAVITCFPLDTIRTRLLVPSRFKYEGVRDCVSQMIRKEGFASLYRGVPVSVISVAPSSAVFYGIYHFLKHRRLHEDSDGGPVDPSARLDVYHTLLYGAVAGASAEATLYPLEVIRRQVQMQQASGPMAACGGLRSLSLKNYVRGMSTICVEIARKQGIGGFYSGIMINTLQVLPNAALSFFTYEAIKSALGVKD